MEIYSYFYYNKNRGENMEISQKKEWAHSIKDHKQQLLNVWEKKISSQNKESKKIIIKCGELLFNSLPFFSSIDDKQIDKYIHQFAKSVIDERLFSNLNIQDFVYNVNIGRTVIIDDIFQTIEEKKNLQQAIHLINRLFDLFLFHTISYYTTLSYEINESNLKYPSSNHQERLSILGQMTSSFVHEFRNPLTSIQGFIQLLHAEYPTLPYLNIIRSELEQLNFRITQFLLLSKKETSNKDKTEILVADLIEEVLNFLYPSILDVNVQIIKNIDPHLRIFGSKEEIRQVLINIIFNAIDVLQDYRDDPKIFILATELDNKVIIHTQNNGPKIPDHIKENIFEPFVTTKKRGTGLGLYVCKQIINNHQGELLCESNDDLTTFTIKLPLHK
jgi:signal transduction histidine kinase